MPAEQNPQQQTVMRLALEHRVQIWAYLMGLAKDPHKAEDLFQNTYLIICSKWAQFQEGTNFLAWARRIARFEFLASVDPGRKKYVTVEAEVLESALDAEIKAGQSNFVINMGKLTYISSAGLGVLLGVLKRLQAEKGDLILTNVPDKIKRIVDLLGFSKLFKIFKTEDLALDELRKQK